MIFRFIAILATCMFLWTSAGLAASDGISDILVTKRNNELLVSARLRGGFNREIKKEIISGVSKEFFYYMVIKRVMPGWLDEEKVAGTVTYFIKYDILTQQFLVTRTSAGPNPEKIFYLFANIIS